MLLNQIVEKIMLMRDMQLNAAFGEIVAILLDSKQPIRKTFFSINEYPDRVTIKYKDRKGLEIEKEAYKKPSLKSTEI